MTQRVFNFNHRLISPAADCHNFALSPAVGFCVPEDFACDELLSIFPGCHKSFKHFLILWIINTCLYLCSTEIQAENALSPDPSPSPFPLLGVLTSIKQMQRTLWQQELNNRDYEQTEGQKEAHSWTAIAPASPPVGFEGEWWCTVNFFSSNGKW